MVLFKLMKKRWTCHCLHFSYATELTCDIKGPSLGAEALKQTLGHVVHWEVKCL